MNFKMKMAAVAAFLALSAPAFAGADYEVAGNLVGEDVNLLAQTELAGVALSDTGNVAFINQETAGNIGYIDQLGATNFASIVQSTTDGNIGVIYQTGDLNRAAIYQH